MLATLSNSVETVDFLLKNGADVTIRQPYYQYGKKTALGMALKEPKCYELDVKHIKIINTLTRHIRNSLPEDMFKFEDHPEAFDVFLGGCEIQDEKLLVFLTENVIDLNYQKGEQSILSVSCEKGLTNIVKILIDKGVDVNQSVKRDYSNNRGFCMDGECSPLFISCESGNLEIVNLLIQAGAKINFKTTFDDTPLGVAFYRNNIDIFKVLIKSGADKSSIPTRAFDNSERNMKISWKGI